MRTVISSGSPLNPPSHRYVYRAVKPDELLASISGRCDALANPQALDFFKDLAELRE